MGVSPKLGGYHFGGPYYKDYNIFGSIWGSPYPGKLPYKPIVQRPHRSQIKTALCLNGYPAAFDRLRGLNTRPTGASKRSSRQVARTLQDPESPGVYCV